MIPWGNGLGIIVVKIHWSESNSVKKKIFRGYKKILNTQKLSYSTVIYLAMLWSYYGLKDLNFTT